MKRKLLYNTALLTASSLLMSGISMAFQVWLVGRIGSAGIGLYQLVLSVTGLCATFAISGIRFASTRLVAEELGLERPCGVRAVMSRCLAYGAFFGLAAAVILWELAGPIGARWAHGALAAALGPEHALRVALFLHVRLFHRLRQSVEADACPPDRTACHDRAGGFFPGPRPGGKP